MTRLAMETRSSTPGPLLRGAGLALALAMSGVLTGCQQTDDPAAKAREHIQQGDYRAASIVLKGAMQVKPDHVEYRLLMADVLEHESDLVGLEQQLRKALQAGGDENQLVPRIALAMLDRNDFEPLTREFQNKRLQDSRADSTLRGAVALSFLALRRPEPAEEQLRGAAESPAVATARAQLLLTSGKLPEALAQLAAASQAPDTPWWVLRAASRVAKAGGDLPRSLEFLQRAYQAAPRQRSLAGEYGEALVSAGRIADATTVRDQLRQRAPNYFWTHYLDALVLSHAGRLEESHAAALKVLRVMPEHLPAGLLASAAELSKGEVRVAHKRLEAMAKLQPDALPVLRLLAQSQMRLGRPDDAASSMRRGLAQAPRDPQLLAMKADFELGNNQAKQAAATLGELLQVRPGDPDALLRLADVRFLLGERPEAARLLQQAAGDGKGPPALQSRLVSVALRMNDKALARRLADQALAAQPDHPQLMLTLAAVQSAQGDGTGAWKTTLAVLDKQPGIPNALTALSAMARTSEQRSEVLARHAKAVQAKTRTAKVYLDYAALLRANPGAQETPRAVLERGVAVLPEATELHEALVQDFLRAGDAEKALAVAQAHASGPHAPAMATALLGSLYERLGRIPQATEVFRKLAAEHPQRPDWRFKLAQLEVMGKQDAAAVTLLRGLIAERPFDAANYVALAGLASRNNPAEALSVARQMAAVDGLQEAGTLLEGDLLLQAGKRDDALQHFNRAAKAGMVPAALLRAVRVLDAMDRGSDAEARMAEALRRHPDDVAVAGFAAARLQQRGDAAKAADLLQRLAKRQPANPIVRNDLAWAQVQAGLPDALDNARLAAAALPDNANVLHTLGMALVKAGKREEGIAALRASTNLAPTAALPRLHLSESLLAAGDRHGASTMLRSVRSEQLAPKELATLDRLKKELLGTG